jgi:hypothetical protein
MHLQIDSLEDQRIEHLSGGQRLRGRNGRPEHDASENRQRCV